MPPSFLLTSPNSLKFSCTSAENGLKVRVVHRDKAMFFNCTAKELVLAWENWKKGEPVEIALSFLDGKEHYYLTTGNLPEEVDGEIKSDIDDLLK